MHRVLFCSNEFELWGGDSSQKDFVLTKLDLHYLWDEIWWRTGQHPKAAFIRVFQTKIFE